MSEVDLTALVRSHGPRVWRTLRRVGVREADVPDVAQEVFLVAHRRRDELAVASSQGAYLLGIAVRLGADYRRRAHIRRERPADAGDEQRTSAPHLRAIEGKERMTLLDRALMTLDDDARALLVLYEIEEVPMRELAVLFACPEKTAYGRLYAAREALRRSIQRLDTEGVLR